MIIIDIFILKEQRCQFIKPLYDDAETIITVQSTNFPKLKKFYVDAENDGTKSFCSNAITRAFLFLSTPLTQSPRILKLVSLLTISFAVTVRSEVGLEIADAGYTSHPKYGLERPIQPRSRPSQIILKERVAQDILIFSCVHGVFIGAKNDFEWTVLTK